MTASTLQLTQEGNVTVVLFSSPCISDVDIIQEATDQLIALIKTKHPNKLLFDFSEVKFFSSQLLGVLIQIRAQISSYQGKLALCSIAPQLTRVFSITNLDRIFTLAKNRSDAISILNT